MTLNEKISWLERQVDILQAQVEELQQNQKDDTPPPFSKIGKSSFIDNFDKYFDGETGFWKSSGVADEINVETTYLVKRTGDEHDEDIDTDDSGTEMKSVLYDEADANKRVVEWDDVNKVWKFYGIYKD